MEKCKHMERPLQMCQSWPLFLVALSSKTFLCKTTCPSYKIPKCTNALRSLARSKYDFVINHECWHQTACWMRNFVYLKCSLLASAYQVSYSSSLNEWVTAFFSSLGFESYRDTIFAFKYFISTELMLIHHINSKKYCEVCPAKPHAAHSSAR